MPYLAEPHEIRQGCKAAGGTDNIERYNKSFCVKWLRPLQKNRKRIKADCRGRLYARLKLIHTLEVITSKAQASGRV
ncbi:Uncharacterised protein [Neisseria animalis]|nr:Uncharacterised protein [Neisseria animalis]